VLVLLLLQVLRMLLLVQVRLLSLRQLVRLILKGMRGRWVC
jgi:hypothetical protein